MEDLIPQVPKDTPRKKVWAEILDIKGSAKSDATFIKRRELVEKELLETIAKKNKKQTEKDNTTQVFETVAAKSENLKIRNTLSNQT